MKAMTIGISPYYNYPGTFEKWMSDNTYYASNHGGSLITRAIMKEFNADYVDDFSDIRHLKNKYAVCFMALATHAHKKRDISRFVRIVEQLQMKTVILSLGVQDYIESGKDYELHHSIKRLLDISLEGNKWIGVRGPYTASILHQSGYKDVWPIGCPTVFWNMKEEFELKVKEQYENPLVVYHKTIAQTNFKLIENIMTLGQDFQDQAIFTESLKRDSTLLKIEYDFYNSLCNSETVLHHIQTYGCFPMTFEDWFSEISKHDFVFGPRLHGVICALIQGIPAVLISRDLRVKEMTEFFCFPFIDYKAISGKSISDVFKEANFEKFKKTYKRRFQNYLAFLNENAIKTNFSSTINTEDVSSPIEVFTNKHNDFSINEFPNSVSNEPFVSVCVQTYQHAKYIKQCLDGILMQKTNFQFEVLLGEDASTDGTREICINYAEKYPDKLRLFLHRRENNISINGQPTGRFNGVYNFYSARGKYIALCEGDDYWTDPYKLQKQVDFLEANPEYAGSFHETQVIFDDGNLGKIYGRDAALTMHPEDTIATGSPFHTSSFVFKRNVLQIPEWFYAVVSGDMALFSIASASGLLRKIPEIMSVYRKHAQGLTNSPAVINNFHKDRIKLITHLDEFHHYKYHMKAKRVIDFHQSELSNAVHYGDKNNLNKISDWTTVILTEDVKKITSMLSAQERQLLYMVARDYWKGTGAIIDAGCFVGGSTLSLSKGILANRNYTSNKKIIYSCDLFVADRHQCENHLKSIGNFKEGDSIRDVFNNNTSEVSSIIEVYEGDIRNFRWNKEKIEILFIDVAKSWELNDYLINEFFPYLIRDHSIIIQQDFVHPTCPWLAITMEFFSEYFVPMVFVPNNTIVFKLIKEIPAALISLHVISQLTSEDKLYLMDKALFRYKKMLSGNDMVELECARCILKLWLLGQGAAEKELHRIRNVYANLPRLDRAVLWVEQRISKLNKGLPHKFKIIKPDNFLNPVLSPENMDLYIVRSSILQALKKFIPQCKGTFLDIGCGEMPYKSLILSHVEKYIGLDIENHKYQKNVKPDIFWNGRHIPLDDNSVDCAMATELFEHVTNIEPVLNEIKRVLKPGGSLFFTVPFLWPLHDNPQDEYRYTPFSLKRHLQNAGFSDVKIEAMGGWDASLAQMIGLWVRRSPMADEERNEYIKTIFPFYQYLLERESSSGKLTYDDMQQKSMMITGLSGMAVKQDERYREIETLLDQNRYEEAFAKLDVFVKENPSHAPANNDLGTLYNHAGDKDKALQYVKRAVDLEPDNSVYKKNLGTLYFYAGNIKESFNIFKGLLSRCPNDIDVLIAMGGICQKFNMKDNAKQFYLRALEFDPGNAVVRENLANKYKSTAFSKGKVVVITDQFPVLSQTFIMEQITGLIDRGFNVENWTLQIIKDSVIHPKVNEYNLVKTARLIRLPADNMQAYPEKWVEEFKRINNISGFQDIMAFHIHFGPNFNRFGQLFKILNNFIVVSFHGYDGSATIQIKGKDIYKYLFERVNVITTPSHYMRAELIRNGCKPEKIRVHRYGVDINRFTRVAEANKESTVLLTVARFVEKKGLEYAIKAFALLPSNIKATYRLVGDGPLYEIMQDLVKDLNIQDRVLFLGAQPQDVVQREMANADIFVLTSVTVENGDKEGVPVCLIEAHAMELPVISTKHAGIPELIIDGKSGFLAEEKDVEQIGLHMQTLVNDGAMRRRFGKSGREQVINEFNIDVLNDTLAGFLFKGVEAGFKKPWNWKGVVCPICLSRYDEFMPFGLKPRPNALCPNCNGVERHRLLWLYLQRKTNFFTDKLKVLDIAPTKGLSEKIKALPNIDYMSIDMSSKLAMRHMDITAMDFPENTFDCVICYHVLEHIPDDRKAMSEIFKVMKPGGWAILQVPIKEKLDATLEGSHIADPAERKRLFGQEDHVRYYGLDYKDRLGETGFTVKVDDFVRSLSPDEIKTYALTSNENIYFCKKEGESVNAIKTGFGKDAVKVVFAVTETGEMSVAGDYFTALELGLALKDKLGWDVEWLPMQKWYDVEGADILIAMTDHYDLKRLGKLSLELVKVCWMRNWFDRWAVKSYFQNWDIYLCSSLKAQIHLKEKYGIYAKLFRIANNHKRFYQTTDFQDKTLDYCFTSNYWNADRDIEKIDPEKIGYSFALFGKNWEKHPRFKEYYKGFVPYAKLPEIYNQTKILVDDANHVTKEWGSVNSRVFDAIASGTLVISNSAEASQDVFNGMLDVYKDVEDLKRLMDKYINNKDEYKEKIGLLRNIVLSGHTYNIRAEEFMGILREYLPNIKYGRKKILENSISSLISDKKTILPEVSIIIPVFNQAEYTKKCMESIVMNTPGELYEVVIIDNGSTAETKELLKYLDGDVKIITNKVNMGFAKACNQGAKAASGKYLLFLNNDTQVLQHWLQPLVNTIQNNVEIGAVGSKLLYPDGKVQHAGVIIIEQKNKVSLLPRHVFMGDYPYDVPIDYPMFFQAVTAACLLIKKNIFDSVDGFNEAYWNGSEDVDLCFKIRQAGYKVAYEPKSVVIHHESKSGRERIAAQPRNNLLLRQRWSKIIKPDIHEDERGYLKAVSQTIELYNTNAISKEEYFKHMLEWWERYSSCSVSSSTKSDKIRNSNIFNNADISIIISIYNAFEETKACVGSVIENTPDKIQIILLDDGSTDERIWPLLDDLQQRYSQITAIRHETNQGYTKTINHGCRLAGGDVILLNSDTQVTPGWVQKLYSAAYSKDNVATVTPLSNAAGAFSIPYNNQNNTLPTGIDINRFAELVEKYSLKIRPIVPTGNGFCLYIKKKAFARVGYFDDIYFPLGYGEENDFCMRCIYSGMVHLIEDSTFVYHKRSASFKERREAIFSESWQKLLKRHPSYNAAIEKWLANDPLDAFRARFIAILEKEVLSNEDRYSQRFKTQGCNVAKRPAKKVLFINHSLPPYEYSGTPISTLNHALGMKERGIEVAVMIPSLQVNEGFKPSVEHGLKLYKVPFINKYQAFFRNIPEVQLNEYLSGMNKIIHHIAPDIIHINDCVSMPIEIIGLFHNSGIPVVRNVCNDEEICLLDSPVYLEGLTAKLCEGPNSFDKCARCFYKNVLRKGADEKQYELVHQKLKHNFSYINAIYSNFVDGVVFTHELFKEHFTKFVFINPEKIRIIPRGFDFDFERNTSIREIDDNVVNFAFLGNLVYRKGVDVLLKAFEEIAHYDGFRLYIFGATEGSFDAWIESLQKKYVGKIIYCGHFEKDALQEITRKININISPSYFETYNRVVRESIYLGMPVIATDFYGSSIVEYGVNGIKIPIGDFKALANAMIDLINNHQLVAKLSKGAIETNIPKLEDEIDGLLNFYDELIRKKQNEYLQNTTLLDKKGEVNIEPFRMAEVLFQKGAYNEAIDAYKKAIETSPSPNQQLPPEETSCLFDAYYNLALSYVNTQNLDDAIATFQKAVELHNADATIYNNLGVLYFKKKLHDDARHCFEKALAIDANYAEAKQNLEKISSLKNS